MKTAAKRYVCATTHAWVWSWERDQVCLGWDPTLRHLLCTTVCTVSSEEHSTNQHCADCWYRNHMSCLCSVEKQWAKADLPACRDWRMMGGGQDNHLDWSNLCFLGMILACNCKPSYHHCTTHTSIVVIVLVWVCRHVSTEGYVCVQVQERKAV